MNHPLKKGHLLIAEPSIIGDVSFNRAVILLADHTDKGSIGFIMNKPLEYTLSDFVVEMEHCDLPVYNGGPVEQDNLYFIHRVPKLIPDSIEISQGIFWGGDFSKVIEQLQNGDLQKNDIQFFLGYSGWDSKQLVDELEENTWVVIENDLGDNYLSNCCPKLWREKILRLGGDYLIWSNAPESPQLN